jgi:hypothetical protein
MKILYRKQKKFKLPAKVVKSEGIALLKKRKNPF